MFFNPPISAVSATLGFIAACVFSYRIYESHKKVKQIFTHYFFIAVVNFAIVTGLLGLVPLFSPRNFGLWKISDCFVHIFLILNLAYLWRFYLSLTKSPREKLIFWTFLVIGQIFTLIDFIYPKTPYLANPGVIIWNNIPVVGIGIGVFITLGSLPLAFYFFSEGKTKEFLVKTRLFLFTIFFAAFGLGGVFITIFLHPLIVLFGDSLILIGALGMLSASLLRYFVKID